VGGDPNYWIGWIFCLLLGLAINAFRDSANKPLNAIAGRVALYSYGIYLNQVPILYLVFTVCGIKNRIFGTLTFLVLTMVVSVVTYHLIESPFMGLGRKLSSWPPRAAAPLPAGDTR